MLFDVTAIQEILPHRYPFLLVDRILEMEKGKRIVGIKNVTVNEPFFVGHFPDQPIMPGVLIIEAMAQCGGVLIQQTLGVKKEEKTTFFLGIDGVKFRRPVVPGDQLRLELEIVRLRTSTSKMKGQAFVDGKLVCEAELMSQLVDKVPAGTPAEKGPEDNG